MGKSTSFGWVMFTKELGLLNYQRVLSRIRILGFFWEVLWMVAKSGYHQLKTVVYPIIYRV